MSKSVKKLKFSYLEFKVLSGMIEETVIINIAKMANSRVIKNFLSHPYPVKPKLASWDLIAGTYNCKKNST